MAGFFFFGIVDATLLSDQEPGEAAGGGPRGRSLQRQGGGGARRRDLQRQGEQKSGGTSGFFY